MGAGDCTGVGGGRKNGGASVNFAEVEKIAAAILYEGYILYPYRPTAIKNRQRWNFGTLYPRVYAEAQRPQEPFRFIAECVLEVGAEDAVVDLKIQCLQLIRKRKDALDSGRWYAFAV